MTETFKVAGVQMDVALGEPMQNMERIFDSARIAAAEGAQLVVFPECAHAGYCYESLAEARQFALSLDNVIFDQVAEQCRSGNIQMVFGFLEDDANRLYNSAALVGPNGLEGVYRKVHLPFLGVDRFTTSGESGFSVLPFGNSIGLKNLETKLGLNICYDTSFPESARTLSLLGADMVVLPTNWPKGADRTAQYIVNARALENQVFFIAVNRVGTERGFQFIGQSRICDCFGGDLAVANHQNEEIIYAQIEPSLARDKSTINIPGKYELYRFRDRHPEHYEVIVSKKESDG